MQELKETIAEAAKNVFEVEIEPELSRTDEQFGDYSTNAALQLGKQLNKNPREVAVAIAGKLHGKEGLEVSIAGPGFINFKLSDDKLADAVWKATELPKPLEGKTVVAEYSDPNPFKVLHVGHLYTSVVGDAIANLHEAAGAKVHRVNFGGDVGLHVAKTMWAVINRLGGEHPEKLSEMSDEQGIEWLTEAYVEGNQAYDEDENANAQIRELNQRIYKFHEENDRQSDLAKIYWRCREWSYKYFGAFYRTIGSHFDKYYPESETATPGMKVVKENIGKVFEESDGAVVFKGEVHNLHTRVFINREGLPTYETKDVGLIFKKWEDYHFDKSIVITGNDIYEYMQVVLKAVEQIKPELVQKTVHLTHGMVRLEGGEKMASRKGNILKAVDVIEMVEAASTKVSQQKNMAITLGAIKYAFLKNRIGADQVFDPAESVSLIGNSGPYLQYAHARASSILAKKQHRQATDAVKFEAGERSLARKISEYPEVVERATAEYLPSYITTYLYELAQNFNRFYEKNRVIDDARESLRLKLVETYAGVLRNGLGLLGIEAPERL